jgi:CO dehydrogenase/acetyl-CoA synthase beta subunit
MELYNSIIRRVGELTEDLRPKRFTCQPSAAWPDAGAFELVMGRDAACELGGDGKPAVNFTCVTNSHELVGEDEILVFGPDISSLPPSAPFARIALLRVGDIESDEDDTEQAFRAIQNMDFVKYRIFPKGYMIRTSSENHREQIRISKEAIRKGISFERVGNSFLRQYKQDENIISARVLFITAPDADYAGLQKAAQQVGKITMSLTKIMEGMSTDCTTCMLKPICDEVEGMKELHFGKEKHTTE